MDVEEQLSRGGSAASQFRGGPRLSVLENGFNFHDGPAFVAGITRTRPPAPISACELTSSSMGTTESSVSGVQSRVRSRSPGKICHREPSSSSTMWLSEWDRILMARSFRVGGQCVVQSATAVPTGPARSSCGARGAGGLPHLLRDRQSDTGNRRANGAGPRRARRGGWRLAIGRRNRRRHCVAERPTAKARLQAVVAG